jgi:hypothetical protein
VRVITPSISGVTSIECPICRKALRDYDAPGPVKGLMCVRARCHGCDTEQVFAVDRWRGETNVWSISRFPRVAPARGEKSEEN